MVRSNVVPLLLSSSLLSLSLSLSRSAFLVSNLSVMESPKSKKSEMRPGSRPDARILPLALLE